MKRIILLLIVMICFQFSYGEELNAEQQQLAWKFIYENLLDKDNQPTILKYRDRIDFDLEGGATPEDSLFVKELIKSFQKNIPNLKIELPDKGSSATAYDNHTIYFNKLHKPIPDSLTSHQRKQFIYFQLFNGIVSSKKPHQDLPGMTGCVFTENDFKAITFSPLDLFILEKLYSPYFSIFLVNGLYSRLEQTVWKSIRCKFWGNANELFRYHQAIAISLKGQVSRADSSCFIELIGQLRKVLPQIEIFLYNGDGNLIFEFNKEGVLFGDRLRTETFTIKNRVIQIGLPANLSYEKRKKILYYYLYRALVKYSPSPNSMFVPGCVFDEKSPENITFHPIDAMMIQKLYAPDFIDQFKAYYLTKASLRDYYLLLYSSQLKTAGIIIGILLAVFLISILIRIGVFRKHKWQLGQFMIQVVWLVAIYDVYYIGNLIIQNLSFQIQNPHIYYFIPLLIQNLIFITVSFLFFVIERKLNFLNVSAKKRLILLFVNTIVFSFFLSFAIFSFFRLNSMVIKLMLAVGVTLIIVIIRFFLLSLAELSKNELQAKDNELTLLKEKNKQTELQTLRAKINPHFLYNALNSIASLATTDAHKTEQMALALSDFFKYAINREQKQLNTLSEELNATRTYLEIEKVRFGDRLSFEIDCPSGLLEIQIPQLLIQPLVENAIKHGLSQITGNGMIRILIAKEASQLKIRVYDNGPAFPEGPLTGFGIQNTQERISLLYGAKATINWTNGAEKFIEISLPV